jgi:PST family polysaccharide transporter
MPTTNIVEPISQALLPVMARLRKHPTLYRAEYLKLVEMLCMVLMPTSIILMYSATPLVETVLGRQWAQAGLILSILAPTLGISGLSYALSDLFITQDRSAELRTIGVCEMVVRVAAILIGVRFGLLGAAVGWTLSSMAVEPVRLVLAGRRGPVSLRDQVKAARPAATLSVGVALGGAGGLMLSRQFGSVPIVSTFLIVCCGAVLGCAFGLCFRRSRHAIARLSNVLYIPRLSDFLVGRGALADQI